MRYPWPWWRIIIRNLEYYFVTLLLVNRSASGLIPSFVHHRHRRTHLSSKTKFSPMKSNYSLCSEVNDWTTYSSTIINCSNWFIITWQHLYNLRSDNMITWLLIPFRGSQLWTESFQLHGPRNCILPVTNLVLLWFEKKKHYFTILWSGL
jgi:hypothetical protein